MIVALCFSNASCGVKGNPLPPLSETEMLQEQERKNKEAREAEAKRLEHEKKLLEQSKPKEKKRK